MMRQMGEVKFLCKPQAPQKKNLYAAWPLSVIKIKVRRCRLEWHFTGWGMKVCYKQPNLLYKLVHVLDRWCWSSKKSAITPEAPQRFTHLSWHPGRRVNPEQLIFSLPTASTQHPGFNSSLGQAGLADLFQFNTKKHQTWQLTKTKMGTKNLHHSSTAETLWVLTRHLLWTSSKPHKRKSKITKFL